VIKAVQRFVETYGLSDVGRERSLNEDYFCIDEGLGLLIVADGMGGHAAGEIASRQAAETFYAFLKQAHGSSLLDSTEHDLELDADRTLEDLPHPSLDIIKAAAQRANTVLCTANQEKGWPTGQGMGTTIVGLWAQHAATESVVFNIGDSRLYLYRNQNLVRLTTDHSLYQLWLDSGQTGQAPPLNQLTRALGMSPHVSVDSHLYTFNSGDIVLLCSDGLSTMVPDTLIEETLCEMVRARASMDSMGERLVAMSNERGGSDNITVVLARYM
jgi:PPM family protein phosphatase